MLFYYLSSPVSKPTMDRSSFGSLGTHHLVECGIDCTARHSVQQVRVSPGLLTPVILTESTEQFPILALGSNSSCSWIAHAS